MGRAEVVRLVAASAAVALTTACTSSADVSSRTSPTPSPPATAHAADIPDIDFKNGGRCPRARELEPENGCVSSVRGDFDGDGTEDLLRVYATVGRNRRPESWVIRLDRGGGGRVQQRLIAGSSLSYPAALGAVDADGDGRDEAFVKVLDHLYHSGAAPVVGIFRFEGGRLVRVRERRGRPLNIDIGGVSHFGQGLRCDDSDGDGERELQLLRIENATSRFPRWSRTTFEWRGNRVVRSDTTRGSIERQGFPDPDVFEFYQLKCGTFDPPYPY